MGLTGGPRIGKAMIPQLRVAETMAILHTTVATLEASTRGASRKRLTIVTDYGWSVADQLAHLRACHDVLGGNMLRIVREDHPAWKGMAPRAWQKQTDYFEWEFKPAFEAFRAQRAELLDVLEPLPPKGWERTATVTGMLGERYQYSTLYYGDWMARHERSHLKHIARILKELA
ncbi:MAG: DinB family protein [Candidatus Limnocylindrales bacterium]